jgi:hypothetical protein
MGACLCMIGLGDHNARLCLFYSVFGPTCANFRGIFKKRVDVKNRDFSSAVRFIARATDALCRADGSARSTS